MSDHSSRQRPQLPTQAEIDKLPADGGPSFNRLIFESSPYLLQHAANPVDWYAWGDEAFRKAAKEDKPIFLSIGYATCHWCHVMEHESFEDNNVASLMNERFVCIKVDKEERPDIDDIYMAACLAMNGHGGWPLTVLLTPDRHPFFAGTYFPKHSRYGRVGMMDLVPRIAELWTDKRNEMLENASRMMEYLAESNQAKSAGALPVDTLARAFSTLQSQFDDRFGGFGNAPKFPTPHYFNFLLRHWFREGEEAALHMTLHSLRSMRRGGVFDHVGFGFHRYSTDAHWLLPHFEKMLYDQALLALAFLEAYEAVGEEDLARVAVEIFTYVLRDMTDASGGFYSAEDADSEGEEGRFYIWRPEWVRDVLGADRAELFCRVMNVVPDGNFHEESTGKATGDSIPHRTAEWDELAQPEKMSGAALREDIESARADLFKARETRDHPLKDDKVLTDWNGLMIAAMAEGGRILEDERYTNAAAKAFSFINQKCRDENGRLLKRYRLGKAGLAAHLDDYAFMTWAAISLYQATFDSSYLAEAVDLAEAAIRHFADDKSGAFFFTADDSENLIVRGFRLYDGALPSGNSAMALNLVRLAHLTGNTAYKDRAERIGLAFSQQIRQQPTTACHFLSALDLLLNGAREVVIVGSPTADDTKALLAEVRAAYRPDTLIVLKDPNDSRLVELSPFTEHYGMLDGKATAYVCKEFTCLQPTSDLITLRKALS